MHKTYGTGRRKTSSARVYLNSGTGEIKINSQGVDEFTKSATLTANLLAPLAKTQMQDKDDRKVERKKVGLRKARKATQFSKR